MKGSLTVTPGRDPDFIKPGLHSHNTARRIDTHPSRYPIVRFVSAVLFLLGICGIAYYGYSLLNEYVYQAYENWAFEQKIAGRQVTFTDYVRERTPFGFLTGGQAAAPNMASPETAHPGGIQPPPMSRPAAGSVLGRVQIARLNLSAMVREGVDDKTLSRAVGHLPYTALPGQTGNFAIAAHRDRLFRALKDIQKDDRVSFQSPGGTYTYEVTATKIVKPSDLSVVQPAGTNKLLTMITCYPFYYIGSAPKRFIVQARLVETESASKEVSTQSQDMGPPAAAAGKNDARPKAAAGVSARKPRPMRGFSHLRQSGSSHTSTTPGTSRTRHRKPGFWRKLVHSK